MFSNSLQKVLEVWVAVSLDNQRTKQKRICIIVNVKVVNLKTTKSNVKKAMILTPPQKKN